MNESYATLEMDESVNIYVINGNVSCAVSCYLHPIKDIVLTDTGAYKLWLPAPFAKSLWWICDT